MESKEQLLMELLGLTARSLTHLTASMTSMSFELLRSEDEVTKAAGRRMIDRMATISAGLDEHWRLIGELTGHPVACILCDQPAVTIGFPSAPLCGAHLGPDR